MRVNLKAHLLERMVKTFADATSIRSHNILAALSIDSDSVTLCCMINLLKLADSTLVLHRENDRATFVGTRCTLSNASQMSINAYGCDIRRVVEQDIDRWNSTFIAIYPSMKLSCEFLYTCLGGLWLLQRISTFVLL